MASSPVSSKSSEVMEVVELGVLKRYQGTEQECKLPSAAACLALTAANATGLRGFNLGKVGTYPGGPESSYDVGDLLCRSSSRRRGGAWGSGAGRHV